MYCRRVHEIDSNCQSEALAVLTFYFILSMSNRDFIEIKVVVNLQFNSLSFIYDLTGSAMVSRSFTQLMAPASRLILTNNVIFI